MVEMNPSHTEYRKDELNAFELFTNNSTPYKTKPNKLSRSARHELATENDIRSLLVFLHHSNRSMTSLSSPVRLITGSPMSLITYLISFFL